MATTGAELQSDPGEALKRSFSYLVNSIDTTALLPAALDQKLITSRQRAECDSEIDPKKKAETFVRYIEQAVNGNSDNFQIFIRILEETGQTHIASRLRAPQKPVVCLAKETDIDYQCPVCTEPLTEPYLFIKCGHHLCRQCRDGLISIGKSECPSCSEQDALTSAVLDRNHQRKVKNLEVRCSDYKEGCEWVGELRDLHDHLDPSKGKCGIACPFGCDKNIRLCDMREHTRRQCSKRMISCEKCGYYNTYTIVTEKHYSICPPSRSSTEITSSPEYLYNQVPIVFTIDDFSEKKRVDYEWISPSFYTHNKGYKFRLNVHPNGYGAGEGSHLSVFAQLMRGEYDDDLVWPFEGDIRIELLNWKEDKNHYSDTICYNRYNHTNSCFNSYRVKNQETATSLGHPKYLPYHDLKPTPDTDYLLNDYFKLRVSVAVYSTPPLPLTPAWQAGSLLVSSESVVSQFTISEYSKRKKFDNIYFTPPFTTGPRGYNFCLKMYANGYGSSTGIHLTITAVIMKGPNDDDLKWPFTGTIITEVLNWLEDKEHCKHALSIYRNSNIDRVSEGEYGADYGLYKFIAHSSLSLNSSRNTQYLYQDCICVRVQVTVN